RSGCALRSGRRQTVAGTDGRDTRFCAGTNGLTAGVLDATGAGATEAATGLTAGLVERFTEARTAGFGAGVRDAARLAAGAEVRLVRVAGRAVARFGVAALTVRLTVRLAAGLTVRLVAALTVRLAAGF